MLGSNESCTGYHSRPSLMFQNDDLIVFRCPTSASQAAYTSNYQNGTPYDEPILPTTRYRKSSPPTTTRMLAFTTHSTSLPQTGHSTVFSVPSRVFLAQQTSWMPLSPQGCSVGTVVDGIGLKQILQLAGFPDIFAVVASGASMVAVRDR